jgi:hypothetical protein
MMETLNLSRVEALWADVIVLAHDIKLDQFFTLFFRSMTATIKIELSIQHMELIALCVDMMSGERNLELLEALLSQQDLEAYHSLRERVCRW